MDKPRAMKLITRILIVSCLLLLGAPALARGKISSVIVYADRAQVTRSQAASCAAGKVSFTGLPSTLQPETLWASMPSGGGAVAGLTYREEATGPQPGAEELQQKIRALDTKLVAASRQVAAARAIQRKLTNYRGHVGRMWGKQAAGKKPNIKSWEAGMELLKKRELAARLRARKAATRSRELNRERALIRAQLQLMERKRRRTTLAVEVLLGKCTGSRRVDLAYTVPGASWDMRYQLRAAPGGKKITVVAQAAVRQGTGEDWRGVRLALSTANLMRKNDPPTVRPIWITSQKPADSRKVLTRRFEHRKHLKTSASPGGGKKDSGGAAAGAPPPGADLAMSLPAAGKVIIPADGREVMVTLGQRSIAASWTNETVPKLFPFIYNKLTAVNPFAFPMLPGPAELFSGRSSLGRTWIKLHAPGEPLSFTLGVQNQLQVKRYVKKEKLEGPGAFGSKKKLRHRYGFSLGNWTKKEQTIVLLENLPVSRIKDVKITLGKDATRPTKWNKEDGVLTWKVKVPPRSKKAVTLDFTVQLPKDWVVQGYK